MGEQATMSPAGAVAADFAEPDRVAAGAHSTRSPLALLDVSRLALIAAAAAVLGSGAWDAFGHPGVVAFLTALVGGWPIFAAAIESLVERRMTMELSMTIALLAALAIGDGSTALLIAGFVLGAEILERLTVSRGRRAVADLLELLPREAHVWREGRFVEIPLHAVAAGDRVLVRPASAPSSRAASTSSRSGRSTRSSSTRPGRSR